MSSRAPVLLEALDPIRVRIQVLGHCHVGGLDQVRALCFGTPMTYPNSRCPTQSGTSVAARELLNPETRALYSFSRSLIYLQSPVMETMYQSSPAWEGIMEAVAPSSRECVVTLGDVVDLGGWCWEEGMRHARWIKDARLDEFEVGLATQVRDNPDYVRRTSCCCMRIVLETGEQGFVRGCTLWLCERSRGLFLSLPITKPSTHDMPLRWHGRSVMVRESRTIWSSGWNSGSTSRTSVPQVARFSSTKILSAAEVTALANSPVGKTVFAVMLIVLFPSRYP